MIKKKKRRITEFKSKICKEEETKISAIFDDI